MNLIKKIFKNKNNEVKTSNYTLTQLTCFHNDRVSSTTNDKESIITRQCSMCGRIYSKTFPHSEFYKEKIYPYLQNTNK